jgi:L-ascorbate 6-phosphate lactonase
MNKLNIRIIISLLFILVIHVQSEAQETSGSRPIIQEIKNHQQGMAVWWTGHNGWVIKSGSVVIGTDLCLESEQRAIPSPVSAAELAPILDISLITHEHGDHFERETSKILLEKSRCIFVMPATCLEAAQELKIPAERIRIAEPRKPFAIGEVKIDPLRAIHGNPKFAIFYDANLQDCGYLITVGGKRLLQMGDTVLLEDHLFLKKVDVLFFSPTEHNTYIDQSLILINELEPDYILPQHRDTFQVTPENRYWTTAYSYEVKFRLSKSLQEKYFILKMGEKILIQ